MPGAATMAGEPHRTAVATGAITPPRLRECRDCGQFQVVPSMRPGSVARCLRCDAVLRRTRHDPLGRGLALNLTSLCLLLISCTTTLMTVSTFGMFRSATGLSGPFGFGRHGIWELALVVGFMTVGAPLLRLTLLTYVLAGLRLARPPLHLRSAFRWAEQVRPWAMIDVFLLGVFVAYAELPSMVHIEIGVAVFSLIGLNDRPGVGGRGPGSASGVGGDGATRTARRAG